MHLNIEDLYDIANAIISNIESKGLERYDPRDIRDIGIISYNSIVSKTMRKGFLFVESLCPILMRKAFSVEKKIYPTMYTHIAEAYYITEKYNISVSKKETSLEIMMQALNEYLRRVDDMCYWESSKNSQFFVVGQSDGKIATMNMHGLARLNIILLKLAKYYNKLEFAKIARDSAIYAIKNHQLTYNKDGVVSISYYYNSNDCTLNVNTEFAQWLSMVQSDLRTKEMDGIIEGIIRLMINEQNTDGSWYYFSKKHMREFGNVPVIDCHHTGTVLYNLINVLDYYYFDEHFKKILVETINRGMDFYINNFFDSHSGKAKTIMGYKRPAGPVQYSEAIISLCDYLESKHFINCELVPRIKQLLPKLINQLGSFVNVGDGSVPSEKVIRWIYIDSIRWGNGPLLQAIIRFLSIYDELES